MVDTDYDPATAEDAAMLAVLLQERGLGGQFEDIETRFERFVREHGAKADAARMLAQRIARLCGASGDKQMLSIGGLIGSAFPDRIAKRRDAKGEDNLLMIAQGYLSNQGDAWEWTQNNLERALRDELADAMSEQEQHYNALGELQDFAAMLGQRLKTKQTAAEGLPINQVYVETGSKIEVHTVL